MESQQIQGLVLEGDPWRSEGIAQLAAGLAAAQGKIRNAAKDASNPHFRTKYADLAAVWDACRLPLSENGLSVSQHPRMEFRGEPEIVKVPTRGGDGERYVVKCIMVVSLTTRLLHSSGEWMESTLQAILPGADPQTVGSALTYLRRYGLSSMVGVAPDDDDDGNASSGRDEHDQREFRQPPQRPAPPARPPSPAPSPRPAPAPQAPVPEGADPEHIIVAHVVAREGAEHPRTKQPFKFHKVTFGSGATAFYFAHERPGMAERIDGWLKAGTPTERTTEDAKTANGTIPMLVELTERRPADAEADAGQAAAVDEADAAALAEQEQFLRSELPAGQAEPRQPVTPLGPVDTSRGVVPMTDDDIPFAHSIDLALNYWSDSSNGENMQRLRGRKICG